MKLSDAQIKAMNNLLDRYQSGTPRCLQVQKTDMPCVIFTDGACEHGKSGELLCSIGGVIFDPAGESTIEAFGAYVSDEVVESWMRAEKGPPCFSDGDVRGVCGEVCLEEVHRWQKGFPLSEARGKDGPFIPCYARLPLDFPKAGVTRRIRLLCAALCAACTRARRCVCVHPFTFLNCLKLKPDMCDLVTMFL